MTAPMYAGISTSHHLKAREIMLGRKLVHRLQLYRVGLYGNFKKSPHLINTDAVWLDKRQFRRYTRALAKLAP